MSANERIDQIIADALAGMPETDVAILAREVVRLRGARAVIVPAWDANAFALACVKAGAYAEGDLRDALKNAETGYNFAISSARTIPADRVLGEGMVGVPVEVLDNVLKFLCVVSPGNRSTARQALIDDLDALRANQGGADHD